MQFVGEKCKMFSTDGSAGVSVVGADLQVLTFFADDSHVLDTRQRGNGPCNYENFETTCST